MHAIENAHSEDEDTLDIRTLLSKKEYARFHLYEEIVASLFASKTLHEGLTQLIDGHELTTDEQITVLMFLKLFESFSSTMKGFESLDALAHTLGGAGTEPEEQDGGMYA